MPEHDKEPGDLLTMREVCRFFGGNEKPLDQSTIYDWVRKGWLAPSINVGPRLRRWRLSDCRAALAAMQERKR